MIINIFFHGYSFNELGSHLMYSSDLTFVMIVLSVRNIVKLVFVEFDNYSYRS